MRTLQTSSIAAIVERLRPLLHIDPVSVLPPEITAEIFSYLSPAMLLEASRASKAWRESTLDSRLWKHKFHLEGWGLDMDEVRGFEQTYKPTRLVRTQRTKAYTNQQKRKKRLRDEIDEKRKSSSPPQPRTASIRQDLPQKWASRHDLEDFDSVDGPMITNASHDEEMHDVGPAIVATPFGRRLSAATHLRSSLKPNKSSIDDEETEMFSDHSSDTEVRGRPASSPNLIMRTTFGQSRLNYHHVFKQKKKLEDNWNAGSYRSFQLPHKDHPEEAHSECVYTIQYIGNYLVSGSRDRTLRIWDLETQRLVRKPLTGHTASVLCLQFDNREKEDIIISGSSDTDVILWQFSTGKMIRKIPQAHNESVLNLKFDERFLVTCSKDKTIKIWNRHDLRPGDKDYPIRGVQGGGKCPAYILNLKNFGPSADLENYLTPEQRKPLKPYTPLMLIDSHGAAVNAIHIYQDQLVSASGDRHVKVFDIHTGVCTAICRGHTKGIACVQYDGKRIVSGSSDNTIRIYDPATQAEVACLQGHSRLVRTIQSAFGDVPGSREQLELEAMEVDQEYYKAKQLGNVSSSNAPSHLRNAGSRKPEDLMAIGAKLPPGGGGSKWGRIVSGSYDETIIIWKKASDGRWVMGHRLRQEEALRAAGGPLISQSDIRPHSQNLHGTPQQNPQGSNTQSNNAPQSQAQHQPHVQGAQASATSHQHIHNATQTAATTSSSSSHSGSNIAAQFPINSSQISMNPTLRAQLAAYQQSLQQQLQQHTLEQQMALAAANGTPNAPPIPQFPIPSIAHLPLAQQQHVANVIAAAQSVIQTPPPPPIPTQHLGANNHPASTASQPNARVFKLQFDARRIICCSQDPKIVGWDFANGDEKIIECSKFFAAPL